MDLPNPKELKKLADTCRKCGIKSFQSSGFSFTLTDDAPVSPYKTKLQKKSSKTSEVSNVIDNITSDSLTQEQLLMWSTGELPQEN